MTRLPKTSMLQLFLVLLSLLNPDPDLIFWIKAVWIADQFIIVIGWRKLRGLAIAMIMLSLGLYLLRPKGDL